jgi:hypothetical protein
MFLAPHPVRVLPTWVPVAGGRRVDPRLVVAPLLAPIAILALVNASTLGLVLDGGFAIPADNDGLPAWSFWGQLAIFWIWGAALTAATFLYWCDTRRRPTYPRGTSTRASASYAAPARESFDR